MKYVENSGVSKECLERGYEYTGDIPNIGENVFNPESDEREKQEAKFNKKYGIKKEEDEGFLERNNYFERM